MKLDLKISNYLFWIFLSLFIKGVFFWSQVYLNYNTTQPLFGHSNLDFHEYYGAAENFFISGTYSPDVRMPGLGVIYLLLRPLFEKTIVLNIILIMQWIIASVAAYVLALTVSRVVKKESVFYFVFFLNVLTHYIFIWSTFLASESLCISFFIFSLYFLNRFHETAFRKYLFWCGFFLTWCVFLRPIFFLFYGIVALFLLFHFMKNKLKLKTIIVNMIVFLCVFILFDSVWTIRNYHEKNKLVFLSDIDSYTHIDPSVPEPALWLFLQSWGGDTENEFHWFEYDDNTDYKNRDTILPTHIYTSQFNRDSLLLVKERIRLYKLRHNDSIMVYINNSLQNYTQSIKKEKPYLYYVGSGFFFLKKLIFSAYPVFDLPSSEFSILKKIYKIGLGIMFYFIFFTGLLSSVWFILSRKKNYFVILLASLSVINIIYIAFVFRYPEFRYLQPSILGFMCITGIVLGSAWDNLKRKTTSAKQ